jgi:aryl-alcohol dehydrogenase-like predicted oxidoreductase
VIYRNLGPSGLQVSVIGLGTNRFGSDAVPESQVRNILDYAQETGINMLDTANVYQKGRSEETLGKALKGRWDKFVLATKVYFEVGPGPNDMGGSRYHIQNQVEASLGRLQSDHIDLYYMHRWHSGTPIDETLRALDDLVRSGKVRYLGCSDYTAWQLAHANLLAELKGWTQFVVIQSEYNLFNRDVEREVLPYCQAHSVGFIPYFPLAGGFLTGKYRRGQPAPAGSRGENSQYVQGLMKADGSFDVLESLEAWARARGRGLNELAQAWLLAQRRVCSVISGATRLEQVQANVKAVDWSLSETEEKEVRALLSGLH